MDSRYTPLSYTLKDYPYEDLDEKTLGDYFRTVMPKFSEQERYQLLTDSNFIDKVLTTNRFAFRYFIEYVLTDNQTRDLFFSSANKPTFEHLEKDLKRCLDSITKYEIELIVPQLLQEENQYILSEFDWQNSNFFPSSFISVCYKLDFDKTNQHLLSHPKLVNNLHLLKELQVNTPLNSSDLNFLIKIKEACGYDYDSKFYSLLDTSIINAIIDGGYYSILSNKDKNLIISNMCDTHTDFGVAHPYTSQIFKQKDFLKYVIAYCDQDCFLAIKFLKYLDACAPELHEAYHQILNVNIKNKENKTANDIAFIYFGDYLKNVTLNLKVIKDYAESNPKYKAKLDPYIFGILSNMNFDTLTNPEEISDYCYELEKTKIDFSSIIYDYMSLARDTFASEVKESLTDINDCDDAYETEGVKVHYYDGKDFAFIIHATSGKNGEVERSIAYKANSIKNNDPNRYLSTSYISQKNLNHYNDSSAFLFGYNKLDGFDLVGANVTDAFVNNVSSDPLNHPPTYQNLDDFSNHDCYSELLYKKKKMEPDFLVCLAPPDEYEIALAKKLNIDIVYINPERYKNKGAKLISAPESSYRK